MCPAQPSPQHSVIPVEWKMRETHGPTSPDPRDPQAVRTLWCEVGSPVGSSDRGGLWGPVQEGAGVDEEQMLGKAGGPRGSPFPGLLRAVGGRGRLSGERDMSPGVAASCGTPRLPGTPPGAGSGVWAHTHTHTYTCTSQVQCAYSCNAGPLAGSEWRRGRCWEPGAGPAEIKEGSRLELEIAAWVL